jgi:hypothetical protein
MDIGMRSGLSDSSLKKVVSLVKDFRALDCGDDRELRETLARDYDCFKLIYTISDKVGLDNSEWAEVNNEISSIVRNDYIFNKSTPEIKVFCELCSSQDRSGLGKSKCEPNIIAGFHTTVLGRQESRIQCEFNARIGKKWSGLDDSLLLSE